MNRDYLVIFARNPVAGKVKTRLARTLGEQAALSIYCRLLSITASVVSRVPAQKVVYYSDFLESGDCWDNAYARKVQSGHDLGQRMATAFADIFGQGGENAVLIGTDCPQLSAELLESAFAELRRFDVVIGPATDGGYYLLGMKRCHRELFEGIQWSTNTVLQETLDRCSRLGLRPFLLTVLSDIDDEDDWIAAQKFIGS